MKTKKIDITLLRTMKCISNMGVAYEKSFDFKRRLGITGEVGEILLCYLFDMVLVVNGINGGFDAINAQGEHIQIKSVRKNASKENNQKTGRLSRFSMHEFKWCYLVIFNKQFEPEEIWKAHFDDLKPVIEKQKRRNPTVREFIQVAQQVTIPVERISEWYT